MLANLETPFPFPATDPAGDGDRTLPIVVANHCKGSQSVMNRSGTSGSTGFSS